MSSAAKWCYQSSHLMLLHLLGMMFYDQSTVYTQSQAHCVHLLLQVHKTGVLINFDFLYPIQTHKLNQYKDHGNIKYLTHFFKANIALYFCIINI
jgi:hypothetical protein